MEVVAPEALAAAARTAAELDAEALRRHLSGDGLPSEAGHVRARACDTHGFTLLHHLAIFGRAELVRILAREFGVLVDAPNQQGVTPLLAAVTAGNLDTASALLDEGASATQGGALGGPSDSPVALAVERGHAPLVRLLVRALADVNARSGEHREPPLSFAARSGQVEVLDALLEAGADALAEDERGFTPLMQAAAAGHAHVVTRLIAARADASAAPDAYLKAASLAADTRHADVAQLLLAAGPEGMTSAPPGTATGGAGAGPAGVQSESEEPEGGPSRDELAKFAAERMGHGRGGR